MVPADTEPYATYRKLLVIKNRQKESEETFVTIDKEVCLYRLSVGN